MCVLCWQGEVGRAPPEHLNTHFHVFPAQDVSLALAGSSGDKHLPVLGAGPRAPRRVLSTPPLAGRPALWCEGRTPLRGPFSCKSPSPTSGALKAPCGRDTREPLVRGVLCGQYLLPASLTCDHGKRKFAKAPETSSISSLETPG